MGGVGLIFFLFDSIRSGESVLMVVIFLRVESGYIVWSVRKYSLDTENTDVYLYI